jgi:hypothetical protein
VSTAPTLRPSAEMRSYLIEQLNHVLRRPGMYGPHVESTLWMMFDHLAYLEGADTQTWWKGLRDGWSSRGAFAPTGVAGSFKHLIPGDVTDAVSSLFAEEARARDWLTLDRTLTTGEYESIRGGLAAWAQNDRSHGDVLAAFGPPSIWFGSRQPRHGKTLGYFPERREDPAVMIHLWNENAYASAHDYQAPVIAARCGHGPLPATIVFTPEGARTRPAA